MAPREEPRRLPREGGLQKCEPVDSPDLGHPAALACNLFVLSEVREPLKLAQAHIAHADLQITLGLYKYLILEPQRPAAVVPLNSRHFDLSSRREAASV